MRWKIIPVMIGLFLLALSLSACASSLAQPENLATDAIDPVSLQAPTNTVTAAVQPTVVPTAQPTVAGPAVLNLWWPEPLAPVDDGDAADLLSEQISGFQAANQDVEVAFRLKKATDVGGIMSTLRAASLVAPGALPDLTLMRRSDVLAAAQAGLIQPFDDRAVAPILDDLHPVVAELGRVNDRLYGLPYNVEVQHLAYQSGLYSLVSWSFANVLAQKTAFVFPAGRATSLSDVFLVQYRSQTDTLSSGGITIDTGELRALFQFYQQAVTDGVIDPVVLEYIVPTDYRAELATGSAPAGIVTSSLYLWLLEDGATLDFAPIPTESGTPTTVVDGWMWVLTTADAERQAVALRFLNWMLDIDRQGRYNQSIYMLPSQRTALRQWEDADYASFVDTLLNNATLPLAESNGGVTARVIQSALASVISGQRTAEQATQDVITQLPS